MPEPPPFPFRLLGPQGDSSEVHPSCPPIARYPNRERSICYSSGLPTTIGRRGGRCRYAGRRDSKHRIDWDSIDTTCPEVCCDTLSKFGQACSEQHPHCRKCEPDVGQGRSMGSEDSRRAIVDCNIIHCSTIVLQGVWGDLSLIALSIVSMHYQ